MITPAAIRRRFRDAGAELLEASGARHLGLVAAIGVAAILPALVQSFPTRAVAWVFYYAVAVMGLNFVMGLGNMASIGHGAFVAVGALVATLMRTRMDSGFLTAVAVATAATALSALVVGFGVVRLRSIQVAVSSWLGVWLMSALLVSFPAISGGAEGIVVPEATVGSPFGFEWRITENVHYQLSLLVLAGVLVLFRCVRASSVGLTLATIKQNPREASAMGTLRDDLRLKVFVFGSSIAGLAGALGVHLSGIFDARSFGVLLSITLFLAVLLGGTSTVVGPVAAAFFVSLLPIGGQPLIPFLSTTTQPGGELGAGLLLLAAVAWRGSRAAPAHRKGRARRLIREDASPVEVGPARLEIADVTKRFGGVVALDGVGLTIEAGRVHGIMGSNGSGKSTLLAVISGHLFPDEGTVLLDGVDITTVPAEARLRRGIARSLQSTELFSGLTALEHLEAASLVDRRYGGFIRSTIRTPLAREEERRARGRASSLLEDLGLSGYAQTRATEIPAGARRLLMMGVAISGRSVILLDEPSAGMSPSEVLRSAGIISTLKERNVAVVVVEHNMRLLSRVADVITVLDGSRVIARGEPGHIFEHPEVRAAYLGRKTSD
jgi:ABC-type branched-subunit amino acid transport system ATPase component/ABC-type branched-subunit amino acid transport system permease subunit